MPSTPSFHILDSVDSTNNYAMTKVHAGLASHGMAWFALEQTRGKGQRGKTWDSEKGKNIALSVVLQPQPLKVYRQFYLSAAVSLACFELFSRYAGNETKIKWPNDIYWRDRKAGGILIENVFQGSTWAYAVVGIGININQENFDTGLINPVSLKQITGIDQNPVKIAKELHAKLMKSIDGLHSKTFKKILEQYNHHLYGLNKTVRLKKGSMVFETSIKGVSSQGQLLTADATERHFDFGDVEWIPSIGPPDS